MNTHTQKLHECGVLDSDVFSHVFCFSEQLHGCETVFVGEQHELIVHRRGESSLSTAIMTFKFKHPLFFEAAPDLLSVNFVPDVSLKIPVPVRQNQFSRGGHLDNSPRQLFSSSCSVERPKFTKLFVKFMFQ